MKPQGSDAKIGLFSIGLDTYWPQFEGLLENLLKYHSEISRKIQSEGVEVIDAGMVDNMTSAKQAEKQFGSTQPDLVFLFVSTYALSATVLPVIRKLNVPVIVLNLQPVAQLNYEKFNALNDRGKMTGVWLEHCQACSVPELAGVFNRAGISYDIVSGFLNDDGAWIEIYNWIDAAKTSKIMQQNRMGILGHYYSGMLDVYSDLSKLSSTFGTHFEILEMCELHDYRKKTTKKEIRDKIDEFYSAFAVSDECEKPELERAAKTAVALDKLVENNGLKSLAYYYEGEPGNEYEDIVTSVIAGNTLLTGKDLPVAGECEVKNAHAMKIMSALGAGGSFSEFYLMDFVDDVIFLGHDGPAHFAIAEGQVKLVPLPVYHGKPGKGLSIQMKVKTGPVTLLSVVEGKEDVFLLMAEGESVEGDTLQIGNTNSRYKFPVSAKEFINRWSKQGPSHHCAIGVGHLASTIEKVGKILKINVIRIC